VRAGGKASPDDLRAVPDLAALPGDLLDWLAASGEVVEAEGGERLFKEGDPADHLLVVLAGAYQVFSHVGGQPLLFDTFRQGRISGALPYSRLTHYPGYATVIEPTRLFRLHKELFPEMLRRSPELGQRLVSIMSDRVRDATRAEHQREKMMALGKLAAGLAHELNNPAAAVRRSADSLRERLAALPPLVEELVREGVLEKALRTTRGVLEQVRSRPPLALSALERSGREDELTDWLDDKEVADGWQIAETLVEAGVAPGDLDRLAEGVEPRALSPLVRWLGGTIEVDRLTVDIASAAGRISELVGSVKTYSHMDQAQDKQPTDLRPGLDSTLIMLGHELKAKHIRVVRADPPEGLPTVPAYPGELNQVWTNLFDNAIDALAEGGELRVETAREGDYVLVRVIDDGKGIPPDVQSRIFEPFFTTKGVGEGTGLGLEIAERIVRRHSGQIGVESRPGRTVFTVRLPGAGAAG
jgi:signal transduction histidine kinase